MKTMKRALLLALTLITVSAVLSVTAWAEPGFDSSETICLYVGQKIEYQRPEPFALDYAGLTAYFKSDDYYARAYTAEVIFGAEDKPDWLCLGIQPSKPGRFLYYGYTEVGAGTEHNLNPYYTVKDTDLGTHIFWLRVTMAISGGKTKTVVHKVTLIVEKEPRVVSERTIYLLPDKEPLDGRAVIKPGSAAQPADLAFPLPAAAWKTVEPEDHAAGQAAFCTYDYSGELPTRLAIGSRHITGVPYYMPDWEDNSGPYLYRFDYAWPTAEGEYTVLFRIRPRGEGNYFTPFNYRVRFIVSPAGAPYDLWIDGIQVDRLNAVNPTGDGAFCYDPDTKTLKILGSHESSYTDGAMIVSKIPELQIASGGKGSEYTLSSPTTCLELQEHTTLTGDGRLRLKTESGPAVKVVGGKRLTLQLGKLVAFGESGDILGSPGSALYVERSLAAGAVTGFDYIWWDETNAELIAPAGGHVQNGAFVNAEGEVATHTEIIWYQPYDIWIEGERITEKNWRDNARKGWFFFNAVSSILYIRGGSYTGSGFEPIVRSSIEGLRISVHGDMTLTMPDGAMYPIFELSGDTEINAMEGKALTLECGKWSMGACIQVWNSTLTLSGLDGLTLRRAGGNALEGGGENAGLVVEESVITVDCGSADPYIGGITGFRGGVTFRYCGVEEPEFWRFDEAEGSLTDGEGKARQACEDRSEDEADDPLPERVQPPVSDRLHARRRRTAPSRRRVLRLGRAAAEAWLQGSDSSRRHREGRHLHHRLGAEISAFPVGQQEQARRGVRLVPELIGG